MTTPILFLALLLAAYTGFRMPNVFSMTVYNMSLTDGFHRRIVVGTLLRPLAAATGYNYYLFAAVAFIALLAFLTIITVAALRTRLVSQRFLVIAYLLLPMGGYLFNEVGYLDQILYVLLFFSLWLALGRSAWVAAACVMVLAVFVHESATVTVIPIFAYVAARDLRPRRALAMIAPSAFVVLLLLATSGAERGAIDRLNALLADANFGSYDLTFSGIGMTISEQWRMYSVRDSVLFLFPIAVILGAAFVTLAWLGWRERGDDPARDGGFSTRVVRSVCALAAIAAPAVLAFGGWDLWRWAFLLITNFFVVVWLWLGETKRELNPVQFVVLGAAVMFTVHVNIGYFELEPRTLHVQEIRHFAHQVGDGSLFQIPDR